MVAADHRTQAIRAPVVPIKEVVAASDAVVVVPPTATAEVAVDRALGAVVEEVQRPIGREVTTKAKAIVELAAVGVAVGIVVVAAHRRCDVPTVVVLGRTGAG